MNPTDPQFDAASEPAPGAGPEPAQTPHAPTDSTREDGAEVGATQFAVTDEPAARLAELASRATSARLTQAEEEEAISILRGLLTSGGHSLAPALAALPSMNWNVAATAVTAAWPEMSHTAREAFVSGLKREDQRTEAARRIRLSLARGLFKQDIEVAAKIIGAVCAEMKKSGGEEPLSKSERRNFDAVMIGKGRPWICQLPLVDWRPAESAAVLHVALAACFGGGNVPPFTQLSLLKWIADADRLDKLPEDSLQLVIDGVARWSPKWKAALRKEISNLPEPLTSLVSEGQPASAGASGEVSSDDEEESSAESDGESESDDDAEDDEEEEDELEATDEPPAADVESGTSSMPGRRLTRRERGRLRRLGKSVAQAAASEANGATGDGEESDRRERSGGRFDVREALRQIERQYSQLKTELDVARSNLRQRDEAGGKSGRGRRGRAAEAPEPPMPESEVAALRQHNARLEETVAELRARVEELTGAAEDEAISRDAFSDGPTPGEREQFQALIGLRLAQTKSDFDAIQGRERDDVFDENYKTLLESVFNLLSESGVTFPKVERPSEPHMQSM